MLGERILPQSEVITAILLEDSPCCGIPHRMLTASVKQNAQEPCLPALFLNFIVQY